MLRTLKGLVLAVMSALVVIGIALALVIEPSGSDELFASPWAPIAGVVVLGGVLFVVIDVIGYRAEPISPTASPEEAVTHATAALQNSTMLRLALADSVAIISVALAFLVTEDGLYVYLVGAVLSLALLGFHVFPWQRPLARVDAALEREGAASPLRAELGLPPT